MTFANYGGHPFNNAPVASEYDFHNEACGCVQMHAPVTVAAPGAALSREVQTSPTTGSRRGTL